MSRNIHSGFRSGERHGWIDKFCSYLDQRVAGNEADAWLAGDRGTLPRRGGVVALPTWIWVPGSREVVGRKAVSRDGGVNLLPVRVVWQPSPVAVVPTNESATFVWTATGLGQSLSGELTVSVATRFRTTAIDPDRPLPDEIQVQATWASGVRRTLEDLSSNGRQALWQAGLFLEPMVSDACRRAAGALAREFHSGDEDEVAHAIVDEVGIEQIQTQMLYGPSASDGPADVLRMLDRALRPDEFRRVDPLKWAAETLRRDATHAVRRHIDDPRCGSKIRALRDQLGVESVEALVAEYRNRHPNDSLGEKRAERALTRGGDVAATATSIFAGETTDNDPVAVDRLTAGTHKSAEEEFFDVRMSDLFAGLARNRSGGDGQSAA